jgi:hypothetical protein
MNQNFVRLLLSSEVAVLEASRGTGARGTRAQVRAKMECLGTSPSVIGREVEDSVIVFGGWGWVGVGLYAKK